MSLLTCLACKTRRAVGLLLCPHCGAAEHDEGDTVSGATGVTGSRYVPEAYAVPAPADVLSQASDSPAEVLAAAAAAEEPPAAEASAP